MALPIVVDILDVVDSLEHASCWLRPAILISSFARDELVLDET